MAHLLHLNFLVSTGEFPKFTIYRKERKPEEPSDGKAGIFGYDLPENADDLTKRGSYLVSLHPREGYSPFVICAAAKIDLTRRIMLEAVTKRSEAVCAKNEYIPPADGFTREITFMLREHDEGNETIVLQPYYLGVTKQFGYLIDFHFLLRPGMLFNRRVQQLSLSLDGNFRRNLDYYADRLGKIHDWLRHYHGKLFPLQLNGSIHPLHISPDFVPVPAKQLQPKTYVLGSNREYRSQFVGIKDAGPLEQVPSCPPLIFVFREQDRDSARRLARALKGTESQLSFPGFEKLFHVPLRISSKPVVVTDFSQAEMIRTLKTVQSLGEGGIPVLVMPKEEDAYVTHKSVFAHAGIATQVCTTDTISDDYALKWSVANIALQLFCKAGGKPWKVKPVQEGGLIIGISQSHKMAEDETRRRVEKYFAFSILTDSSGLFQSLNVIGQSQNHQDYLGQLSSNLKRLLAEQSSHFKQVVLHTSFKLKHQEMQIIENVVKAAAAKNKCKFAVVKVNQHNRFFAINNNVNSLVPYEGSYVQLGHREYLLWFEGVFPDNPSVKKAFPGPTHLEFLRVSEERMIGDQQVLQDLVNLSGANWRGFNAKSAPVSIFYCHLVAEMIRRFQERNLPLPEVKDLRPWFL